MIKNFCDWCGTELLDNEDWKDNPFARDGEICSSCFDLMKRVFDGKYVVQVTAIREGGIEEVNYHHMRKDQ